MSVESVDLLVQFLQDVTTVRIVGAVGLVILLYDHILSLPEEVRYIWSAQLTSGKWAFLLLRYLVPLVMVGHTIQLSGLSSLSLSDKLQRLILTGWVTIAINNWLVLLRLWVLWERNRILIVCTLLVFVAAEVSTLVLACVTFIHVLPTISFEPTFQLCIFTNPSALRVVWIPAVVFQSTMLMAMGWKVYKHPQAFKPLRRDGFLYYCFLWALDVTNCVIFLVARLGLVFVTMFFLWCFTTTATCRLILGLRRSSERARMVTEGELVDPLDDDPYEEDYYANSIPEGWQPRSHIQLDVRGESSSTVRGI
ncbi:hypothetical protein C8R46DRAFT_1245219 [Mycena filopes]|nr:hypothetical protein C8R46DRAFT_1245219 [Mycena filopes]